MKTKSLTLIILCVLLTAFALFALSACSEKKPAEDRVYENENQTVKLSSDGTFVARLAHGVVKTGTYTEQTDAAGVTTVTYTVDGKDVTGTIKDNILIIPEDWEDVHNHGNTFKLQ